MRGEYRAIHAAIVTEPEFLSLSVPAKCLWFVLKLKLGMSGIQHLPAHQHQLRELSGMTLQTIEKAKKELRPHWLLWEGDILWLRNGLKWEPKISLDNKNHRKGVLNHLSGLPAQSIVKAFCDYYELPDIYNGKVDAMPLECHSNGIPYQEAGSRKKGKGTKDKDDQALIDEGLFMQIVEIYPKRKGSNPQKEAKAQFLKRMQEGVVCDDLILAVQGYTKELVETDRINTPYVMQMATFLGPKDRWLEYAEQERARRQFERKRTVVQLEKPVTEAEQKVISSEALKAVAEAKKILKDRRRKAKA